MVRSHAPARRRALTPTSLLVAVAIIAVLIGLLLPAVQKVREAAARAASQNNLKQIALGMHNFASTYNDDLPWGNWPYTDKNKEGKMTGPFAAVLPFIEQQNVFTAEAADATIKTYVSPADVTSPKPAGLTSYSYNAYLLSSKGVGNLARIPDGTSNTVLTSEQVMHCGANPTTRATGANLWNGGDVALAATSVNGPALRPAPATLPSAGTFPNAAAPLLAANLGCLKGACVLTNPSGAHRGGIILVGFGDGSVRTVSVAAGNAAAKPGEKGSSNVNWNAALSPSGGELLGSDW